MNNSSSICDVYTRINWYTIRQLIVDDNCKLLYFWILRINVMYAIFTFVTIFVLTVCTESHSDLENSLTSLSSRLLYFYAIYLQQLTKLPLYRKLMCFYDVAFLAYLSWLQRARGRREHTMQCWVHDGLSICLQKWIIESSVTLQLARHRVATWLSLRQNYIESSLCLFCGDHE